MKLTRNALLAAAGLLALSLPAHAFGTTSVTDTPVFKAQAGEQYAQGRAGSFTDDGYGRIRSTSAGSVGFKKSKKKTAKTK